MVFSGVFVDYGVSGTGSFQCHWQQSVQHREYHERAAVLVSFEITRLIKQMQWILLYGVIVAGNPGTGYRCGK